VKKKIKSLLSAKMYVKVYERNFTLIAAKGLLYKQGTEISFRKGAI
jgi:hypothetical protein